MIKKPSLTSKTSKEERLKNAKRELGLEDIDVSKTEMKQTTVILEANLLYSIKEVAIKRKRAGIKPNTITSMIRHALQGIVDRELDT